GPGSAGALGILSSHHGADAAEGREEQGGEEGGAAHLCTLIPGSRGNLTGRSRPCCRCSRALRSRGVSLRNGRGRLLVGALAALGCDETLVVGADPTGTPGPPSLTQGLVAYWKLDDGPGVNRALDSSGRADHAIPE